jgi:putative spermidine/putrescine transport system permease protein
MGRRAAWAGTAAVAGFLIVPILVVIPISFGSGKYLEFPPPGWSLQWYRHFFADKSWLDAAWMSLRVAFLATATATVLGTMAALALTRRASRGSALANAVLMTPLVVPVIVYAVGAYALTLKLGLASTMLGLVVTHSALALPFVVVNVGAPLRTVDRRLERAALSLGASPLVAFRTVVLPLILPGVLAGALFAFITSFDEAVVALFLTDPASATLPVKMWSSIRLEIDPTIAAPATMLIVGSTAVLALAGLIRRERG